MKKLNKIATTACVSAAVAFSANAAELSTNTAIMQAMDKITGQVDLIEVPVNQEVTFGTFSIVVRECKTRTPEETPENFAFVDVVDQTTDRGNVNIFKGWMISSSPALNPVAHPVYDVWLLKCVNHLVEPKNQMTEAQLAARDELAMLRKTAAKVVYDEADTEATSSLPTNADGTPINLIPEEIAENTSQDENTSETKVNEKAAENKEAKSEDVKSEEVKAEKEETTTETFVSAPDENAEKEEGEPQALVNITEPEAVVENVASVQESDYESFEEALPEKTEKTAENIATAENNAEVKEVAEKVSETIAETEQKVDEARTEAKEKIEKAKTELEQKAEEVKAEAKEQVEEVKIAISEEKTEKKDDAEDNAISRLEQELSQKMIGE